MSGKIIHTGGNAPAVHDRRGQRAKLNFSEREKSRFRDR